LCWDSFFNRSLGGGPPAGAHGIAPSQSVATGAQQGSQEAGRTMGPCWNVAPRSVYPLICLLVVGDLCCHMTGPSVSLLNLCCRDQAIEVGRCPLSQSSVHERYAFCCDVGGISAEAYGRLLPRGAAQDVTFLVSLVIQVWGRSCPSRGTLGQGWSAWWCLWRPKGGWLSEKACVTVLVAFAPALP
jgi:hypothetical protein